MPASIHPELKLSIVLDEESFQGDADAEIERRFTAVAPTEVVRAEKGSQRANVIEFDVGMNAVDEDAAVSYTHLMHGAYRHRSGGGEGARAAGSRADPRVRGG